MLGTRGTRISVGAVLSLIMVVLASPAARAAEVTKVITSNIVSGAQFDLFTITLREGSRVVATLVCDFDGVSRPLDPVLSVFTNLADASDTINAFQFNDDGFGTDDDPNGIDCDAFDSSRVRFTVPFTQPYTFRFDGFGSSTGPYTFKLIVGADVVVGAGPGGGPNVRVFGSGSGAPLLGPLGSFFAFDPSFSGGVRVAAGDVRGDGDGILDLITAPGAGGPPVVRVFDGATGADLGTFIVYDPAFTGGVFVAAGRASTTGGQRDHVITGTGAGGGPHVRVLDLARGTVVREFLAYDSAFTGGVRVAAGDVNADGADDIVTGAGPGGGPHVRVLDGSTGNELKSFFAFVPTFIGGVFVAAGDVNGDGAADIITGAGPGGGPHVRVFDGVTGAELASFFAFAPTFTGGVVVGAGDVNGDGKADIITGAGPGGGPHVRVFDGVTGTELAGFFAFAPTFGGGVFVAP